MLHAVINCPYTLMKMKQLCRPAFDQLCGRQASRLTDDDIKSLFFFAKAIISLVSDSDKEYINTLTEKIKQKESLTIQIQRR